MSGQCFLPFNADANVLPWQRIITQYCNMMSDLNIVLSDQNGNLVRNMSFHKNLFAALLNDIKIMIWLHAARNHFSVTKFEL